MSRARVLWYAPFFLGSAAQVWNAVDKALDGELWFAVTSVLFAGLLALWPVRARQEFREAWSDGFLDGLFAAVMYRGNVPEAVLQQTITGDVAPEPWDAPPQHDTVTERETP